MIVTGIVDSFGVPTNARDVSKAFHLIKRPETPLLNVVEMPGVATNKKHGWWDDARQITQTNLGAAYVSAALSFTLASTAGLRVGSLFSVDGILYRVTGVTSGTVVTVALVSGADAGHASGAVATFIGNAAREGEDYEDTDYTTEVERENVCQILTDFIKVTGTEQAITREVNAGDIILRMAEAKLNRLYLALGRVLWQGVYTAAGSNADRRVMGGVDHFINANGNKSTAAFSSDNFDAFLLDLDKAGAILSEVWINPAQMALFANMDASKVQMQREDKTRGVYVDRYLSKYGHELEIKTDMNAAPGKIRVFRAEDVKMLYLAGRQMQVQDLDKTGDSDKKMLVGEYTAEIWNSATMGVFTPSV